jgi:hypothetical protein
LAASQSGDHPQSLLVEPLLRLHQLQLLIEEGRFSCQSPACPRWQWHSAARRTHGPMPGRACLTAEDKDVMGRGMVGDFAIARPPPAPCALAAPSLSSCRTNVFRGPTAFTGYEPLPLTPSDRNSERAPFRPSFSSRPEAASGRTKPPPQLTASEHIEENG